MLSVCKYLLGIKKTLGFERFFIKIVVSGVWVGILCSMVYMLHLKHTLRNSGYFFSDFVKIVQD